MDLSFHTELGRFNFRVGAVIIMNNKLLLVSNKNAPYYYSIGGRVKYNETCEEAVKREVREELGIELEIDRPLYFEEKFFDEKVTGEHFHEIGVYYLMKINDRLPEPFCSSVTENGDKEYLEWIPIDELNKYTVFPSFLKNEIHSLPKSFKMITEIERR